MNEFKLRLTVWSLIDQSVQYISNPKHESSGIDFSLDGKMMAVAVKSDIHTALPSEQFASDTIGLYNTTSKGKWECVQKFSAGTHDLLDLRFAKDGKHLVVWDSPLSSKI